MFRLLFFLNIFPLIFTTDINNFIPFGNEYNDKIFEQKSNDITDPIFISIQYPFFNTYYDQIRISSHGLIIFGNNTCLLSFKIPNEFPLKDLTCVAPYWIDTNITHDSINHIFYREILLKNEANTLYQITKIIRNGFPKLAAQRMLWAFVVTWYEIPDNNNNSLNRNTYQAILTTNGYYSFTLFNYHQLQWSQGSLGNHAQIGFNAGDKINYYKLNKSFTSSIINIINESNIGIPGQFVFHTTGNIRNVECETSNGLQISPFRGSIYGGYEFRLHGICFNETNYEVHIDGHILNDCHIINTLYMICIMPMLMDSGKLKVELFNGETKQLINTTYFLSHVPEDHGELILSNYINLTNQIADPNNDELILQFQSNDITRKYLFRIIIYDYATQLSNDDHTLYNRTRQRIDLGLGYLNLSAIGNLTIRYDNIFPVTTDPHDRIHALQISFEMKPTRGWLRSALFVGAKVFTAATSIHAAYCPAWLLMQRDPAQYIAQIPVCPCQVPIQPWHDEYMGFKIDEGCNPQKPIEKTCTYHRKARGCYRKKSDISWAGAQCCYDEYGKFIEQGQEGAGTLDVISPDANSWLEKSLSMFGHFFSDFLSYWSCCRSLLISESMCKAYYHYRPAGQCEHIENESIEKHGNPHFVTLNGSSYTFRGEGEYTLLSLPKLNGQEIQIRLASNNEDNKTIGIVAFVIGLLEGKKRIQFELFPIHQHLEIRIDTQLIELPHEEFSVPVLIYEDEYVKIKRKDNGSFKISFPNSPFRFRVHIRSTFDFFDLETLLKRENFIKLSTPSYGLLGDINGLIFPNETRILINQTDENILYEYGESWRVSKNNSLFYYLFDDNFHSQSLSNISNKNNQENYNDDILQECENEHCHRQLLNENNKHHWEPLTVTIEQIVLPQKILNNAFSHTYSYLYFLLLFLYILLRNCLI